MAMVKYNDKIQISMRTNKNFKKQEVTRLARLLDKGYLRETETGCKVIDRRGKKFTQVDMTFSVEIAGIDLAAGDQTMDEGKNG